MTRESYPGKKIITFKKGRIWSFRNYLKTRIFHVCVVATLCLWEAHKICNIRIWSWKKKCPLLFLRKVISVLEFSVHVHTRIRFFSPALSDTARFVERYRNAYRSTLFLWNAGMIGELMNLKCGLEVRGDVGLLRFVRKRWSTRVICQIFTTLGR